MGGEGSARKMLREGWRVSLGIEVAFVDSERSCRGSEEGEDKKEAKKNDDDFVEDDDDDDDDDDNDNDNDNDNDHDHDHDQDQKTILTR